jgi:tetratricopeptide (TPR) repeat protein
MKKILFILLLVTLQACSKKEEKVQSYLESGKTQYQQGNYEKAKIEFKNVVQLDGKQADAYYHLALIDEKTQNWQGMFSNLMQVANLDPKNIDALLKLGRLSLLSGRVDDAMKHVETALKSSPANADALALKGAILVKKNDLDGAMALADQVLKQNPEHVDSISLKTVIFLSRKDMGSALATVEKALQSKPQELALLLLKLQIHTQAKDLAAIEQDYAGLISLNPDKDEYTYALIKHYADNAQEDKALSTLQTLIDKNPGKLQPKLVLIDFQMKNNPEQAEKTLQTYLQQFPAEADLYFRLVALQFKQNKIVEAKQTLQKITEIKPDSKESLNAKTKLAKVAVQENEVDTALKLLKEVLHKDPRHQEGLLLQARLDLQRNMLDDAISNLRIILRDYSGSDEAMVLLGQAYLRKNSPQLAEENFRKALEVNPANFDALLPVVGGLIKNQESARAEELLTKALAVKPDHPGALQALAQVRLLQKDWSGTQKVADLIATKPKGVGFAKFLSGKISEAQGLCKEAIGQYKEALVNAPELMDALNGMANCYENLKQRDAMFAYMKEFSAAHPDNAYPMLLKSQLLTKDKRYDEALKIIDEAIVKWPKNSDFYEAAAILYQERKESDKAIAILGKGLEANPEQTRLSILLATTYEQSGKFDKALETYDNLIAKNPNVDIAANNLISLLLDHFNSKENNERALTLAKRFENSEQPYYLDTYGWALFSNGRFEESLQVFKKVIQKMPDVPVFKYHLANALYKTGNKSEAVKSLEEALATGAQAGGFTEKEAAEKLLQTLKSESAPGH